MGSWFVMKVEVENDDEDASVVTTYKYYLTETKWEIEYDGDDMPDDEDDDTDYDDDECTGDDECEELTGLMVDKIQNLLYVVILAGFAALYFLNEDDEEKGAMACLAMGGAGLLATAMFCLSFPEALEDDTEIFEFLEDWYELDVETSLFGTEDEKEDGIERSVSWRPDIAFALVALSGILGMAAYGEVKN